MNIMCLQFTFILFHFDFFILISLCVCVVEDESRGRESEGDVCKRLVGHSGAVFGTKFSHDKKYLVSCSEDGTGTSISLKSNSVFSIQ
jgi:hypothetical protein